MRPLHLLVAIVLLSSLGCNGAGAGVTPEEMSPIQRWVATRADGMGMKSGFTLTIDMQTGIARLFHDGVMTQEIVIATSTEDGTVATTTSAPAPVD